MTETDKPRDRLRHRDADRDTGIVLKNVSRETPVFA